MTDAAYSNNQRLGAELGYPVFLRAAFCVWQSLSRNELLAPLSPSLYMLFQDFQCPAPVELQVLEDGGCRETAPPQFE